ncbi:unnamed protein product [Rhizophagus irregularis]|nr:unnamed protein product [Rhizophagus irregularis]
MKRPIDDKNPQKSHLIPMIQELPEKDISPARNLISIMRYPKGPNKGKIFSPYLQQKVYSYLFQSFYKHHSSHQFLKDSNLIIPQLLHNQGST